MSVRLSSRTDVRVDEPVVELVITAPRAPERAPEPSPIPARRVRRLPPWSRPLLFYALSRVVVLLAILPGAFRRFTGPEQPWPREPAGSGLLHVLGRWDAAWYLMIARRGYPGASQLHRQLADVAFFPLHPLLVRGVSDVTRLPTLVAGMLLVLLLGGLATLLVWRLADRLAGRRVADRAALLFCVFPGAFSLSYVYAEPLMLVGLAGCLLALIERRWLLAGLAGAVATASRPNAVVVVLACAWAAGTAIRRDREWRSLAAPLLASTGVGGYFLYLWVHAGDAGAWFRSERVKWGDHVSPTAVIEYFRQLFHHAPSLRSTGLDAVILMAGIAFVVVSLVALRRTGWPAPVTVYTAAALLLPLTSVAVGPRPRILMAAFPIAVIAAARLRNRSFYGVVAVSAVALGLVSYLTATSLAVTP